MSALRDELEFVLRDCPVEELTSRCVQVLARHFRPEDWHDHVEVKVKMGPKPLDVFINFTAKTEFGKTIVEIARGEHD